MKTVYIRVTWESRTELEVEDDWTCPTDFCAFTDEQVELIDEGAGIEISPIDWYEV